MGSTPHPPVRRLCDATDTIHRCWPCSAYSRLPRNRVLAVAVEVDGLPDPSRPAFPLVRKQSNCGGRTWQDVTILEQERAKNPHITTSTFQKVQGE
jgi:hypothetical protein